MAEMNCLEWYDFIMRLKGLGEERRSDPLYLMDVKELVEWLEAQGYIKVKEA